MDCGNRQLYHLLDRGSYVSIALVKKIFLVILSD
jgi:hypothetical protein